MKKALFLLYFIFICCALDCKAQFAKGMFFYDERLDGYRMPNRTGLIIGNAITGERAGLFGFNNAHSGLHIAFRQEWYHDHNFSTIYDLGYTQKTFSNELYYSPNGAPIPEILAPETYDTSLEYLHFAFLTKLKGKGKKITPYGFVGFKIEVATSIDSEFDYDEIGVDVQIFQFAFNYGVGLDYNIKRSIHTVGIMLSNQFDVFSIYNGSSGSDADIPEFRLNTLIISAVYTYEITWKNIVLFRQK